MRRSLDYNINWDTKTEEVGQCTRREQVSLTRYRLLERLSRSWRQSHVFQRNGSTVNNGEKRRDKQSTMCQLVAIESSTAIQEHALMPRLNE